MSESNYSVKDLLTLFVIPRLDKIESKLDEKASSTELRALENRLEILENESLTSSSVKELISAALQDAETRGWTSRERVFGVILFLITVATFLLSIAPRLGGSG